MTNYNEINVDVCEGDQRQVRVCYDREGSQFSAEFGPSFDASVRVWFDTIDDLGFMERDGRQVARVRDRPVRAAVSDAMEAALWQAHTGDVSALCDRTAEFSEVGVIEVRANE